MRGSPVVRVATRADAEAVAAIYAPLVRDTVISFEETPPDAAEMWRRMEGTLAQHPWLVAERDGVTVGYAYGGLHRKRAAYRWAVETSVYVAADARRGGVATALYAPLFELLVAQGYQRAFAGVTLPNEASVGFHESYGFEPVGVYRAAGYKHGAWHDVGWWQRSLGTGADPADPVPFAAFRGTEACARILSGRGGPPGAPGRPASPPR